MRKYAYLLAALALMAPLCVFAQEEAVAAAETVAEAAEEAVEAAVSVEMFTVNNTWMLVATFLVFIMHLGFACLETGLTQAKNTVNILFKNSAIPCIGILTYAFIGFNLMYPADTGNGVIAWGGIGVDAGGLDLTLASVNIMAFVSPW